MTAATVSAYEIFWAALAGNPGLGRVPADSREPEAKTIPEQDALDGVDLMLIRALHEKITAGEDKAFKVTVAYLLTVVKSGGLRIPVSEQALSERLRMFFKELFPDRTDAAAGAEATGNSAGLLAGEFTSRLQAGAYAAVLGSPGEFKPLILSDGFLYFQKYHAAETAVSKNLASLLRAPDYDVSAAAREKLMETTLKTLPLRASPAPGAAPMNFNAEQAQVLELSLRKRLLVVSGGPGTGKTSIVANLLRVVSRARSLNPERIRLAAPTGRAAQRLTESLRKNLASIDYSGDTGNSAEGKRLDNALLTVRCETLHKLLRYHPLTGDVKHDKTRPVQADLVVVDETSMVDIFTLSRLLDALPENAQLILMGDMNQLPSVEAGSVLADLVPDGLDASLQDHFVLLVENYRSEKSISKVTIEINNRKGENAMKAMGPALTPDAAPPYTGCRFLKPSAADYRSGRNAWLDGWIKAHYSGIPAGVEELDRLFAATERARILTFTRKSWYGCESVNRHMRERLKPAWDPRGGSDHEGFHGAPILILENDYSLELFNGETGILLRVDGGYRAYFRKDGAYRSYPENFLPRHELAFATTVHKSQGSEYDQILLMLPEPGNRMSSKEILYTALTRARSFAGIYGSPEVFLEAASRKITRESGLPAFLAGR